MYADLDQELVSRFPRLEERVAAERPRRAPDPVGGDILLADIFVPFLVRAIDQLPATEAVVRHAADFIEELATKMPSTFATPPASSLQAPEDRPRQLACLYPLLGQESQALLPTRED